MAPQHDNLAATITRIAAVIAAIVALSLPAGYYGLSHQYQIGSMRSEAHFNATHATQFVALNPDMWHFQQVRLQEMLDRDAAETDMPEQRRILDEKNTVIASGGASLRQPLISARAPLYDNGRIVGYFEVRRSLRPLLWDTGLVALLGLALAAAVFAAFKWLPLRALNRAMSNLRQSEELFSKAFHASPDPVIICRVRDEHILNVNQSFVRLTGYVAADVIDRTAAGFGLWLEAGEMEQARQQLRQGQPVHNLEMTLVTRYGEHRDMLISLELTEINDEHCVLTVARDVTEQKRAEQRLLYLANYDPLTGLPNRVLFRDRLAGAMQRAQRAEHLVGLLYLDLDRFKKVNDSLGHHVGDQLLKQVAERLRQCVRRVDTIALASSYEEDFGATVARMGGDEFTIVLDDIRHIDEITHIAKHILEIGRAHV